VDRVDEVIGRATDLGARGIDRLNQSINSASALVDRVGEASSGWMQVTKELQALGARLAESCDGMEELAQEQRAVIGTVRAVGPEVLASVTQIREQMEGTTRSVAQAMNQVQSSMGRATDDLSGVVTSIREGITEYTRQLAALHTSMDAEMSKAVGKLGGAIQNLDETLGELTENLAEFDRKK
jgi:ABC-type transporter Mla subunit MlaD